MPASPFFKKSAYKVRVATAGQALNGKSLPVETGRFAGSLPIGMQLEKQLQQQCVRRRTLAIISHPDAGKTTLTEKLLLYGGAKELAGGVRNRKNARDTSSDWLELEKQRGISVSSTVLQFEYDGYRVNLLDTPGHRDFSEDTYRVLMAVDAADATVVRVIHAGTHPPLALSVTSENRRDACST